MRGTCTACWLEAEASSCTVKTIQILLTTVCCPLLAPNQLTYVLTGTILGHVVSWDVKSSAPSDVPGAWEKEPVSKSILSCYYRI